MKILGISAFYHDAAAALIEDGKVMAAAQEERFTRKKYDPSFPANSVRFCLRYSNTKLADLAAVVFYDKPFLKFERLLETYYNTAPRGIRSFVASMPVWIREKLFIKRLLRREFPGCKLFFPEHHLSHAASAFYPSKFAEAAILTVDGVGEWATATIGHGRGNTITILREMRFPDSVGLLYSAFTYFLGFKVNSGEYKLMGLAPYGRRGSEQVRNFETKIRGQIVRIRDDGSIRMNQQYFDYMTGARMIRERKFAALFGFPRREPETKIEQHHSDLALAIQNIAEEIVLKMARESKRLTNSRFLCLAGGVALNCVANSRIRDEGIFDDIYVQPAAGDAGGALGAALAAHHIYFKQPRLPVKDFDFMAGSLLGPAFSDGEVREVLERRGAKFEYIPDEEELLNKTAELLAGGKVIGWFQGRMEWGPRALGNRSILADPRDPQMQRRLNLKIKRRESFRPFAPAVPEEDAGNYFDMHFPSPYMLFISAVKRSNLPAITHVDNSARVQTVRRQDNGRFYKLLQAFKAKMGCSVLINTSFNLRGEPIVCSPEDAYNCFMRTNMDYLVINNFVVSKRQP